MAAVTVAPASLTFTAGDWDTAQTVTVRAGQDDDAEDDAATIEHTVRGGLYTAVRTGDVSVTVDDDDTPSTTVTLAVHPQTVAEGVGPTGQTVTVTASLDAAPRTAPTDVRVSVGADTAGAADFTAVPDFQVTIPAGAISGNADFTLAPVDDAEDEADETLTVSGTAISPDLTVQGTTLTIVDNDAAAVMVAFDADRYTATEGGAAATVRVRLSGDPQRKVEIPISHTPDTAAAADYSGVPGTVTFDSGETERTFAVTATDDKVDENDETVALAFGTPLPEGVTLGTRRTATVTLADDDERGMRVSRTALTVGEGKSDTYAVVLTSQPTAAVTVAVNLPPDTDVSVDETSLTFTADNDNWQTPQTITVSAGQDDDAVHDAATISHTVSSDGDYRSETAAPVAVTITDDDQRGVTVTPTELAIDETGSDAYTVVLTAQPTDDVTVAVNVPADAEVSVDTNPDLADNQNTLTFSTDNWRTAQTVTVSADADDDALTDAPVTLTHTVSGAGYGEVPADPVTVRVTDTTLPVLSVADARAGEQRAARVEFALRLSTTSSREVRVTYATENVTAKAGEDYVAAEGTLTFAAGETAKTIPVAVTHDILDEPDEETFTLQLSGAANAALDGGGDTLAATGTIADDDALPRLLVRGTDGSESVADSAKFSLWLDAPSAREVSVRYATGAVIPDSIYPAAEEGVDYQRVEGTLTFAPGDRTREVTVPLLDDDLHEYDEYVRLSLSEARHVRPSPGTLFIWDDDQSSTTLSIAAARAAEDAGELILSVSLDNVSARHISVDWATSDETAQAGSDYTAGSGTLTFPAGTTTAQEIRVTVHDDAVDEAEEETFRVTLRKAVHANLFGGGTTLAATGTIVDNDDPAVTVAFESASYTATEGGAAATVRVLMSDDPERTVVIPISHTPGTDEAAGDYSGVPAQVTFTSGETAKKFTVTATDDALVEDDETVVLGFEIETLPAGVTLKARSTTTLTLADNDQRGVSVSPTALTVKEGDDAAYTVVLTSQPTADVTVAVNVPADAEVSVDTNPDPADNQNTLTFSTDDWDTAQTVRVSAAADDDAVVDAEVTLTHAVSSTGAYDGERAAAVEVRVRETSTPVLRFEPEAASVDEDAGSMTFTVTMSVPSSRNVTLRWSTADGTATAGEDYTEVANGRLAFNPGGALSQTLSVDISDDQVDEENETLTVTLSEPVDAAFSDGVTTLTATVTITDDDTRGVTVSATELTVREGGTGTYEVELDSQPTDAVDVTVTASGDATVDPGTLSFTATDWSTARTVTVSGSQDADAAAGSASITHTAQRRRLPEPGRTDGGRDGDRRRYGIDGGDAERERHGSSGRLQQRGRDGGNGDAGRSDARHGDGRDGIGCGRHGDGGRRLHGGGRRHGDDRRGRGERHRHLHAGAGRRRGGRGRRDGDRERHDHIGPDGEANGWTDGDDHRRRHARGEREPDGADGAGRRHRNV